MRGSIEMYVMNAEIIAAKSNSNWSNQERDLKAYLEREHQFQMAGARSTYNFCMEGRSRTPIEEASPTFEEESHAWQMAGMVTSLLVALRLRKPDRAGE
jgi:hypothetical protein